MEEKDKKLVGCQTLDQITRRAIHDISAGMERYEQFLGWAIEGHGELHMDMLREIKIVELNLTPWKAIQWPDDYMDFVLIGVRTGGQIAVFTNDQNLALAYDYETDDDLDPLPNDTFIPPNGQAEIALTSTRYWFLNQNIHGEDTGGVFGLAVKDNGLGYYRVNRPRREIQLSPKVDAGKAYLEYIANGYKPCKKTTVNLYAAKAIKTYIHWQRCLFSTKNKADAATFERLFGNEVYKLIDRMFDLSIDDVLEAARGGYISSPYI